MDSLIDLTKCREHMTVNIGGRDHQIRLSGTIEDPYFCGKDVCKVLGYIDSKQALLLNVDDDDKKNLKNLRSPEPNKLEPKNSLGSSEPLTYHTGKAVYISKDGLRQLISRTKICGPDTLQALVKAFDIKLVIEPRKEYVHTEAIQQCFPNVQIYKQFKVGKYRVDLYFEEYNLVVECDEYDHRDRNPKEEAIREAFIKSELDCEFIRFNPDRKGFTVFEVIAEIHGFMIAEKDRVLKKVINEKDLIIKDKNHKIKLLKAQLQP
jgi:very-short-patch-repair endonuclease